MEIYKANKQWSTRPEDERFSSLEALHEAAVNFRRVAAERKAMALSTLRVENVNGDVQLVGRQGHPAKLTNWAFGQLAARVGAPADYLRKLPATLAAQNLNHGLAARLKDAADSTVNLLFTLIGQALMVHAFTSERYERIWNDEVTERLLALKARGWDVARPDIRASLSANEDGSFKLPLYLSDHDLFAFIRHADRVVKEPGNPDGLQRGLIVENSIVGASKLRLTRFLYREMCGNHIIWGASDVTEVALVHRGNIRERFGVWDADIKRYLDESASDDEARIVAAQQKRIAGTKEQVLDALFGKKILPRKTLEAAYDAAVPEQDGDPRTEWGFVQGLTRYSQTIPYGDERTALDRAAMKIIGAF